MTPGPEKPAWTHLQRTLLTIGISLAAALALYIVSSTVHNAQTIEDRQLSYEQDLVAMGVDNLQRGAEDNQFLGDLGTCRVIIVIKDDLPFVRAAFYLDNDGKASWLDQPIHAPVLDGVTYLPYTTPFDKLCA